MFPTPVWLRAVRTLALGCLLVTLCEAARGTNYPWTGSGPDHLWSDGQNWSGSQPPVSSADTTITFAGTTNLRASEDISAGFALNSLTFASGAGAFVIGGGALAFGADSKSDAPSLSQGAFNPVIVNNDLSLNNNLAVAVAYDTSSAFNAPALTLNGTIAGPGSLTISGSGVTALTGTNTYTGGMIFAGGTVTAGSAGALGSVGALSFLGGTLRYSAADQTDYSSRFSTASGQKYSVDTSGQNVVFAASLASNGSSLAKGGAGTLTLTGANTFAGGISIGGGVLNVGSAGALGTTGTITIGGTLQYSSANQTDYSSRISTADYQSATIDTNGQNVTFATGLTALHDNLTKIGAGTLTLTGANTNSEAVSVNGGSLVLAAGGSIVNAYVVVGGGGAFNVSGGFVNSSGLEVGRTAGVATVNFSTGTLNAAYGYLGEISGSMATVNQTGGSSNTLMYLGYAAGSIGTYNLSAGTQSAAPFVGYNGSGTLKQTGGTAAQGAYVGFSAGSTGLYELDAGNIVGSLFVGSSGNGTFTQNGGSITNSGLALASIAGSRGTYNLDGGTVAIGNAYGGAGTSTFNFNGGTMQATASRTNFLQTLTRANVQAGGAIIDTNGFNVTAVQSLLHDTTPGAPALDGGLTKLGAGALTLSGVNSYTGGTNINDGMLVAATNGALGTGDVNVGAGATLSLSAGVTAAHDASTGTRLTLASATTSIVNLAGTGVQDVVGTLVVNGVTEPFGSYGAKSSGARYTSIADFTGNGELMVVPEPATWLTVGVALGLGVLWQRRRPGGRGERAPVGEAAGAGPAGAGAGEREVCRWRPADEMAVADPGSDPVLFGR